MSGPDQNKALTNEKWMNEEMQIYTRCSETRKPINHLRDFVPQA